MATMASSRCRVRRATNPLTSAPATAPVLANSSVVRPMRWLTRFSSRCLAPADSEPAATDTRPSGAAARAGVPVSTSSGTRSTAPPRPPIAPTAEVANAKPNSVQFIGRGPLHRGARR